MKDEFQFLTNEEILKLQVFPNSTLPGIFYQIAKDDIDILSMHPNNRNRFNSSHGYFFSDQPVGSGLKARLNLQRPINLTQTKIFTDSSQASTIWEILMGEKHEGRKALILLKRNIGLGEIGDVWDQLVSADGIETIKKNGYDGIISELTVDQAEFIVFDVRQFQVLTKELIVNSYIKGTNKELMNAINELKRHQNQVQKPRIKF